MGVFTLDTGFTTSGERQVWAVLAATPATPPTPERLFSVAEKVPCKATILIGAIPAIPVYRYTHPLSFSPKSIDPF
jgi:hypothetical protein